MQDQPVEEPRPFALLTDEQLADLVEDAFAGACATGALPLARRAQGGGGMSLDQQLQQAATALREIGHESDFFTELADAVDEARRIIALVDMAMKPRAVESLSAPFDQEADPLTEMSRMDYVSDEND